MSKDRLNRLARLAFVAGWLACTATGALAIELPTTTPTPTDSGTPTVTPTPVGTPFGAPPTLILMLVSLGGVGVYQLRGRLRRD